MNIQELLDWRANCFYCGEELTIFPEINNVSATFKIADSRLYIASRWINMSIHIRTGEVDSDTADKMTVDQFLTIRGLRIKMHCLSCSDTGTRCYEYSGKMSWGWKEELETLRAKVVDLEEYVHDKNYALTQLIDNQVTHLSFFRSAGTTGHGARANFNFPYMDLKQVTPQQLESKIKIYTVFS